MRATLIPCRPCRPGSQQYPTDPNHNNTPPLFSIFRTAAIYLGYPIRGTAGKVWVTNISMRRLGSDCGTTPSRRSIQGGEAHQLSAVERIGALEESLAQMRALYLATVAELDTVKAKVRT
jgi:hypothetical protein